MTLQRVNGGMPRRRPGFNATLLMSFFKNLTRDLARTRAVQKCLGAAAAAYLRLVWKTSSLVIEPADIYDRIPAHMPLIVAMWHGQHFMMPFVRRDHRVKVLISRHHDGEINAIAAESLGLGTIRGSGDVGRRFDRKGGVSAFKAMLTAIEEGWTMALTADVPKVARVAGPGIVKLAQHSGREICAIAIATSRRIELANWDRSVINLPFGRAAIVVSDFIRVPADADEAQLEAYRLRVQDDMNAVTARAYALVDNPGAHRG